MKILFLSDLLSYGGASKLIYDLLPRMAKRGHECELLILTDDHSKYVDDLRIKGIPVNVVPKNANSHWAKIRYIKKWVEKGGYDVIHANLFPTIYYCSVVKRMLGRRCPPLVMTEHSTDNKRRHKSYLRPLEKLIYKKYDHVISISKKTQENLCKWLDCKNSEKFSVIENGIDIEAFEKAEAFTKEELCENYVDGDVLLLIVGSFTPQKNHKKLLEALVRLPSYYKLILCGEGPLESEIKDKVNELSIKDRVMFLGFRKDIASIMHSADILVIPSLWEGFGLIAVEGMACGIPIAASDVPGLSEVVGDAGIKFDPNNTKDIIDSISRLNSPSNKIEYAERGQIRSNRFGIAKTLDAYLCVYSSLVGAQGCTKEIRYANR